MDDRCSILYLNDFHCSLYLLLTRRMKLIKISRSGLETYYPAHVIAKFYQFQDSTKEWGLRFVSEPTSYTLPTFVGQNLLDWLLSNDSKFPLFVITLENTYTKGVKKYGTNA